MRQHGLLSRLLLLYERILQIIGSSALIPAKELVKSTDIIEAYIQDFHELLEEQFVFRQLGDAGKLAWLVDALFNQHRAGRQLIADIKELGPMSAQKRPQDVLADRMRGFVGMYRPHMAWEDTMLFPAFAQAVPLERMRAFAGLFKKREEALLGKPGFPGLLERTEELEAELGINQITAFTPDIPFKPVVYPA